jgi:hypothetical protein
MIRIPYPIPEPDRTRLIRAGMEAFYTPTQKQEEKAAAQAEVRKVIADIALRHGIDDGRAAS